MKEHVEDMRKLIQKEIQSITSLKERVAFKELMEKVFLSLYETNEQMYQSLEARVMEELSYDMEHFLIRTGIMEKQYIDLSHHLMSPMLETDFIESSYKISDISDAIQQNGKFVLMKVMLKCDYLTLQELWRDEGQNIQFEGIIKTDREWDIIAELHPNKEYLNCISHLYRLFIRNAIPWQTVNAPYLYKMADVVIFTMPEGIKEEERIQDIQINFKEYSDDIYYNMIPIWNIERVSLDSVGFPSPCEDHKSYEHIISINDFKKGNGYLVDNDSGIESVSRRDNRLYITCSSDETRKWDIYVIRSENDRKIDRYTYPVMQNLRSEESIEKIQKKWNQSIKTKAELLRFIKGFDLEEYLEYLDCEITDESLTGETYDMNTFIEDEIRDRRAARKLILTFKAKADESRKWLIRDAASYIVSEVQRIYPEYECGGKFV